MKDEEVCVQDLDASPNSDTSTEEISKDDKALHVMVEERRCYGYLSHAPKAVFAAMALGLVIVAIYDWRVILQLFKMLIEWVREEPYKAAVTLMLVYALLIVTSMPIVFLTVPLGYAFHQAFDGRFGNLSLIMKSLRWICLRLGCRYLGHHDRCSACILYQ
jgi:hypothetical protein